MNGIYNSYYFWWKLRMSMRRRISRHFILVESENFKGFNLDTLFEIRKNNKISLESEFFIGLFFKTAWESVGLLYILTFSPLLSSFFTWSISLREKNREEYMVYCKGCCGWFCTELIHFFRILLKVKWNLV